MINKKNKKEYFDSISQVREKWNKKNSYYHKLIGRYYRFLIPEGSKVLEIGCGTGDLLDKVKPGIGLGIDISDEMVKIAQNKYPDYKFIVADIENYEFEEKFDYIIISDLIGFLWDIQLALKKIKKACNEKTRIIINSYNYLWEPILKFSEFIGIRIKQPLLNWLSVKDIIGLLELEGFETLKVDRKIIFPKRFPVINFIFNNILSNLPFFNYFCLSNILVARAEYNNRKDFSVSILIPAKNEKGNIENAILRTPVFGSSQEFIFVEGNSNDGTYEEMIRIKEKYKKKNITVIKQTGKGKGNAVREGFEMANNDVLMILDADLTTPPEDLPKFYEALSTNRGEFINGCRLVYPMEKQAMRFLNLLANKFFGWFFSYILGQKVKDTLCGTKVILKSDYEKIKLSRSYFGDFDPFGDFDLLFGAAKLNLKIVEILVRYKDRKYGTTQISRFRHGWLLLKMAAFAAKKIKFF